MRTSLAALLVVSTFGCGPSSGRDVDAGEGTVDVGLPCVGLQCRIVKCPDGMPPTSLSGTVYAPNGTLALYGVTVYVPNLDPGTFPEGARCDRCDATPLPGEPIVRTISDEAGHFRLDNVPAGSDIPLIITVGKWRRKVLIPAVAQCTDNALPAMQTSLPKNKSQGELPKIAIATGGCDALECLVRKIGVSDSEFTPETGTGNVHMFSGVGGSAKLSSGATFTAATSLWSDLDKLKRYDLTLFSCECGPNPDQKPQTSIDTMKAYADFGGRAFLSHYHNLWVDGGTGTAANARVGGWPDVAVCDQDELSSGTDIDVIDQVDNPKGASFATWMVNVGGSATLGQIAVEEGRQTCSSIDINKAERWVYLPSGAIQYPQNFQFTTPQDVAPEQRCGKVVFSDMHVASGSTSSSTGFPAGCSAGPMSAQEKALAFMFFDIAACVDVIF